MTAKRFAGTVSYDGTDFAGSQLQPRDRTVQGELEDAASRLFGAKTRVAMAGRTDSGVHAIGQVAAMSAETRHDGETIARALNATLPMDVSIRDVREVPLDFDPRRWARRRRYRYTVLHNRVRMPLLHRTSWLVEQQLDLPAMQRLADTLVGRNDFIAASGPLEEGRSSERTVFAAEWNSHGCTLSFDIEADAFLPNMVRRLVGASVLVGRGSATVEEITGLLREARVATIGPVAPAKGLCLESVTYHEGYQP